MSVGIRESSRDFGARLRAQREARGVSLREIAAATKVSVAQLEALERNDISRLPGGIFLRSIVRRPGSPKRSRRARIHVRTPRKSAPIPKPRSGTSWPAFRRMRRTGVSHTAKIDYERAPTPRRGLLGAGLVSLALLSLMGMMLWLWLGSA